MFAESAIVAVRIPDQLISIKVSALVNLNLLEKYNRAVLLRNSIWKDYNKEGKINAQDLFDAIYRVYPGVTTDDIASYLKTIHHYNGDLQEVQRRIFSSL